MIKMKLGVGFLVFFLSVTLCAGEYGAIELFRLNRRLDQFQKKLSYVEERIVGYEETRLLIRRGMEKMTQQMGFLRVFRQNEETRKPLSEAPERRMFTEYCLFQNSLKVAVVREKCEKALASYKEERSCILDDMATVSQCITYIKEAPMRKAIHELSHIDIS